MERRLFCSHGEKCGLAISLFGSNLDARLAGFPPGVRQAMHAQRTHLAAAQPPPDVSPATRVRIETAVRHSFVDAFRGVTLTAAALAILAAAGAGWTEKRQPSLS
jgi:hypothetical protein